MPGWAAIERSPGTARWWKATLSGRVRVNAAEGLRAAVLAEIGLAVASNRMFAPELAAGTACRLLPDWDLPPNEL